jgi:hypothetical protein
MNGLVPSCVICEYQNVDGLVGVSGLQLASANSLFVSTFLLLGFVSHGFFVVLTAMGMPLFNIFVRINLPN